MWIYVCVCACICVCDRFANSHARFCTTERNDRFYVCSGLSRDALAIILNAARPAVIRQQWEATDTGGGESVLITLSVYGIRRKLISQRITTSSSFWISTVCLVNVKNCGRFCGSCDARSNSGKIFSPNSPSRRIDPLILVWLVRLGTSQDPWIWRYSPASATLLNFEFLVRACWTGCSEFRGISAGWLHEEANERISIWCRITVDLARQLAKFHLSPLPDFFFFFFGKHDRCSIFIAVTHSNSSII